VADGRPGDSVAFSSMQHFEGLRALWVVMDDREFDSVMDDREFDSVMDDREFDSWYRLAHPRIANGLYLICGSLDVAREATDEAFTRAFARWARVRRMSSPTGWTFKVGNNLLRREARRRGREAAAVKRIDAPQESWIELPDSWLWSAVSALPDRQRRTVVMRYVGDLPEAEIARALGVSRGTVSSNLSRALDALESKMLGQETS
jgi:RNA polymerase sigma-70 factor, ECF subfamily